MFFSLAFSFCAATAADVRVSDAALSFAAADVTDMSATGLLYTAFWPDGADPAVAARAAGGKAWSGTAADWRDMYDPTNRDDTNAAYFFATNCTARLHQTTPEWRTGPDENEIRLIKTADGRSNLSCSIVVYAQTNDMAEAIAWADNASYTVTFRIQAIFYAVQLHLGAGMSFGATALVPPPPLPGWPAPPDGLAAGWQTNLPPPDDRPASILNNDAYFNVDNNFSGPSVVGYRLGPRFICLSRTCCEGIAYNRTLPWPNSTRAYAHESTPTSSVCDWRLHETNATWLDAALTGNDTFPEHFEPLTNVTIDVTTRESAWYTVSLTVLPIGYVTGLGPGQRAYNFTVTGPQAGTTTPQMFVVDNVTTAANGGGMGLGLYSTYLSRIRNMTVRRTRSMADLLVLPPTPPPSSSTLPPPSTEPASSMTSVSPAPFASATHGSPNTALDPPVFFICSVVFLAGAAACSAASAWRARRARTRLRQQREIMLQQQPGLG